MTKYFEVVIQNKNIRCRAVHTVLKVHQSVSSMGGRDRSREISPERHMERDRVIIRRFPPVTRPQRRDNNLIIYGLAMQEEYGLTTDEVLRRFFAITLRIHIEFRKAIRIGTYYGERPTAILVNLISRVDKSKIYSKSHLLKGTGVTIQDDLTEEQREERRRKMPIRNQLKNSGRKVFFRGEFLYCDGRVYC